MTTVLSRDKGGKSEYGSTSSLGGSAPLGVPRKYRRFFWQKKAPHDPDAIATQVSVFDDQETAEKYHPRQDWENYHRFDTQFRWTWREEDRVIRKMDIRIMFWACIMFMSLELDRANLVQALTDNFLPDLHMTTNDYNLGNSVFRLSFLCAELPSQLISKWMGPDRWIPTQMTLWSIVAASQFWLSGRSSFLACRALLGILQGGFIPDGLMTLMIGLFSFVLMPAGPCQTAHWFRGKKGWFNEREEKIMVNRVLREDPNKSSMHNREPITPKLLWQSMKDYDLWPIYILGLAFQLPMIPPQYYITLSLKNLGGNGANLGFDTFQTNLLTIPYYVGHIITMLGVTYIAEIWGNLTFSAMIGQLWALPLLAYMAVTNLGAVNKWVVWTVTTLLLSYPNAHPIQVGWNSRNSNSVRLRTVSAACYNMFVQAGAVVGANIYRADDAPNYPRGNRALLGMVCMNVALYLLVKTYYVLRNRSRAQRWDAMTPDQRLHYLATTKDEGNKRMDFRFQH
ncbi:MFS transporter [Pyricularia oryzae 70-15]|uniref:MFS transporter n=5 Tax=Pyricularia oryzae TaxID=318829 RepID=A0A151V4H5_PYRO7|nr:MFS transporter [Pyricularia oryzae 70-15]KYQ30466.1 MFS transporter [Pyricularia oryzae 70-15]